MKKKGLILLVCLALVSTLAVNGTFATELGKIFKTLEATIEGMISTPQLGGDAFKVEVVSGSDGILAPSHYANDEFPGIDSVNGVVTNKTNVKNVKSKGAYVRICIYVKKDSVLKYSAPEASVSDDFTEVSIVDGDDYTLYNFDYNKTLSGNAVTSDITMKVALIKETTNEDMERLGKDFIQVRAFAIAAESFADLDEDGKKVTDGKQKATPHQALELALGPINQFNPYGN